VAQRLFQRAGLKYDEMKRDALRRDFQPISLKQTCSLHIENSIRTLQSRNVLALLEGSTHADEIVIYSAHWDHLGVKTINNKKEIMYGARDNALSVAALLTLAKAFARIPKQKRKRSVLFFMPTAEEQGLLGSFYYTHCPLFSLRQTVACINFDLLNIFGPMRDICFYGSGQNELEDLAEVWAAKKQQRTVTADPTPENGMFFRSDHFPFALKGVPALFFNHGYNHFQHGREWTLQRQRAWTAECYHKTTDRVVLEPNSQWCWDLSGTVDDIKLAFAVGVHLVCSPALEWPKWKDKSEFKKIRESQNDS
jgi:Zn-dependent M28 family amino/carboxypeptidase